MTDTVNFSEREVLSKVELYHVAPNAKIGVETAKQVIKTTSHNDGSPDTVEIMATTRWRGVFDASQRDLVVAKIGEAQTEHYAQLVGWPELTPPALPQIVPTPKPKASVRSALALAVEPSALSSSEPPA